MLVRVAPTPILSRLVAFRPADTTGTAPWRLTAGELGTLGEELAARYLRAEGLRLIGRNVRAEEAELDIVGLDGDTLVVIEVKAGWWPPEATEITAAAELDPTEWMTRRPSSRVTDQALARRRRAAARLARSEGRKSARVDVVEVIAGRGPTAVWVHHRAFSPGRAATKEPHPVRTTW